jgi:hypothetical protein
MLAASDTEKSIRRLTQGLVADNPLSTEQTE